MHWLSLYVPKICGLRLFYRINWLFHSWMLKLLSEDSITLTEIPSVQCCCWLFLKFIIFFNLVCYLHAVRHTLLECLDFYQTSLSITSLGAPSFIRILLSSIASFYCTKKYTVSSKHNLHSFKVVLLWIDIQLYLSKHLTAETFLLLVCKYNNVSHPPVCFLWDRSLVSARF